MGIKQLNNFLTNTCKKESIVKTHLSAFSGKSVVVDASIYMYRFIGENKLVEHMFLMISIFLHYNITPIFVFDGVPPPEKKDVLSERRENKRTAKAKYELLKEVHQEQETEEMEKLKKQFIHIKESDYTVVKSLLNDYGVSWVTARGEADELCAHLMHTNQVYACLSDDMDMFAYGCHRVFRHFSLVKHTVLFYDLNEILVDVQMTVQEFRQVLVLSGTDYNQDYFTDLHESIRLFRKYKKEMILCEDEIPSFYEWLHKNTKYIENLEKLNCILKMFRPREKMDFVICKGEYNKKVLCETLGNDGFIFEHIIN
jgi:flap endonuclease-1